MRIEDLTIFLNAVDKTKGPFGKLTNRMKAVSAASAAMGKVIGASFGIASTLLVAASANGREFVGQLSNMAKSVAETVPEVQALYNAIQRVEPTAQLDNINEAILTMKERFSDARDAGAGPLIGLIEDFDLNIDLGLDDARLQLANFLEEVSKLPDANAKIFAIKDALGDDDARPFLRTINNTEKTIQLIDELRTSVNDLPDILKPSQINNITDAADASGVLAARWDSFSANVYSVFAPALTFMSTKLAGAFDWASALTVKVGEFFGILNEYSVNPAGSIPEIQAQIADLNMELVDANTELNRLNDLAAANPLGGFGSKAAGAARDVENITAAIDELNDALGSMSGAASADNPLSAFGGGGEDQKYNNELQKIINRENNDAFKALQRQREESARLASQQRKEFESLQDTIFQVRAEYDSLDLSAIQAFSGGSFSPDALSQIETDLFKQIASADITNAQRMQAKEFATNRISQLRDEAGMAAKAAIDAAENPNTALFQQAIYGAQGQREAAGVEIQTAEFETNMALAKRIGDEFLAFQQASDLAAQTAKDAWLTAGSAISTVFDGLKNQIGSYIRITDSMSAAEQKAATVSNKINKKKFEENKLFSRAQAAISAAVGITRALELPFPASLAAAAQVAATAFAQLRAINKTSFGNPSTSAVGGSGASSNPSTSSATGGSAPQQQQQPQRKTTIVLEGRDRNYDADDIQRLVGELKRNGYDIDVLAA